MKLKDLTYFLESVAPLSYQEDYDNSGLICGYPDQEITAALISLDCTEAIVNEAIEKGCNLIISHHPIVFKGLKKFNGKSYVERVVIKAIKNDIALYAIHTNLDHIQNGVNWKICEKLGLKNPGILSAKDGLLKKLSTFVPVEHASKVRDALAAAGAGKIGDYSDCSFNVEGFGTFKALDNANPFVGERGEIHQEKEIKIEVIFSAYQQNDIISALKASHPYEEVAYDIYQLANAHEKVGAGMIASLEKEMDEESFLQLVKEKLNAKVIRHTALTGKPVSKVAVCGGAGSFLLKKAIAAGANVFITGDFKYHEFFDAENRIVIADVGHFESEQFTQELLFEIIRKKFPNFALRLTEFNTNPINYLI
ncbi:Nif3-like dinuclear metal center hexameric protein [Paradesertivirga mongoliensis]|uniref:GTP cyclohydrolase 1 type 2 homolog n=1 Tax=Paradesertivirga mongoliensis TaxID=2100740 RepID=A0ABW4ZI84_9SPHI|nr:Nif3-like dinuclear metal center hexameric protein [Pedobacter mongoliensis]